MRPAFAVAAHITGAYWFTSPTSFANPAAAIARFAVLRQAPVRPGFQAPAGATGRPMVNNSSPQLSIL